MSDLGECYLCEGRLLPGQRITHLVMWDDRGDPVPGFVMHERCKDEMIRSHPSFTEVPEVDLDHLGDVG